MKSMDVYTGLKDKMDQRRFITWYRKGAFDLTAKYAGDVDQEIGKYRIDLAEQAEKKKIKIEVQYVVGRFFNFYHDAATNVSSWCKNISTMEEVLL